MQFSFLYNNDELDVPYIATSWWTFSNIGALILPILEDRNNSFLRELNCTCSALFLLLPSGEWAGVWMKTDVTMNRKMLNPGVLLVKMKIPGKRLPFVMHEIRSGVKQQTWCTAILAFLSAWFLHGENSLFTSLIPFATFLFQKEE
jgi:hypothetical protein